MKKKKEFMLLIRATGNPIHDLSFQEQQAHIQKIGAFIRNLAEEGKLKGAQPFEIDGIMLSSKNGELFEAPFQENETDEIIAGYYHIEATDMEEAMQIARSDPRFMDSDWRIEVRPIMTIDGINS